jgi:hypothetical protein
MPHPNIKPPSVRPSPGVGDLTYDDVSNRVHVYAALHLFLFIYHACQRRSCIPLTDVQTEFEDAGHLYKAWPFERLLDQLIRGGLVELCSHDKH